MKLDLFSCLMIIIIILIIFLSIDGLTAKEFYGNTLEVHSTENFGSTKRVTLVDSNYVLLGGISGLDYGDTREIYIDVPMDLDIDVGQKVNLLELLK